VVNAPVDRGRYLRHILLKEIGAQGQRKLLSARVLIVGAGGLGAPLVQYLAAAGVGALTIADDDSVSLSNLQRQVIYGVADVGASKAGRAREAALRINPDIAVEAIALRIGAGNADRLDGYDLIVEGVDSFDARRALNEAALARRIPLLSAAVGRFEGQVALFKPWAGADFGCYACLVPDDAAMAGGCEEEGVLGPLVGVVGSLAASEAVKEIVGFGDSLAGALLRHDALSGETRRLRRPRDPACAFCAAVARPG